MLSEQCFTANQQWNTQPTHQNNIINNNNIGEIANGEDRWTTIIANQTMNNKTITIHSRLTFLLRDRRSLLTWPNCVKNDLIWGSKKPWGMLPKYTTPFIPFLRLESVFTGWSQTQHNKFTYHTCWMAKKKNINTNHCMNVNTYIKTHTDNWNRY